MTRDSQKLIENNEQKKRYVSLKKRFKEKYTKLNGDYGKYISAPWYSYERELEKVLLPYPKFSFLQEIPILKGMFGTSREKYFSKIISKMPKDILREDCIGEPLIYDKKYLASQNNIEHFYHILNFKKKFKNKNRTIIEWGGGYGNMAKLFWKLKEPRTYVIIDLPIVCVLQWFYLGIIFGEESIHLFQNSRDKIKEGKINIVPVFWANSINMKFDLFISTWALSESTRYAQDFVVSRNWFGAKHLLLAFTQNKNRFSDSYRVGELAKKKGASIQKINYLSDNYYAFL